MTIQEISSLKQEDVLVITHSLSNWPPNSKFIVKEITYGRTLDLITSRVFSGKLVYFKESKSGFTENELMKFFDFDKPLCDTYIPL